MRSPGFTFSGVVISFSSAPLSVGEPAGQRWMTCGGASAAHSTPATMNVNAMERMRSDISILRVRNQLSARTIGVEDDFSADYRELDARLQDPVVRRRAQVIGEHDNISQLAWRERSLLVFFKRSIGGVTSIGAQRFDARH